MILRARMVLTMDGAPIENGAVAISGDRIADVGTFGEVKERRRDEVVDLGESILLPGLINAHCHLDYTCLRGKIGKQKSFADWIRAINAAKKKLCAADYLASIEEGFAECRRFGTTSIANLEAFPELVSKIKPGLRTWWFAELIDVRAPERAQSLVDSAVESLKSAEHWGLAPHSPYTASPNLYRQCEQVAAQKKVLLTTHLGESREEMALFRDRSGPLYEFLDSIGGDMTDRGQRTPLTDFLNTVDDLAHWIVAHVNELSDGDFNLLQMSQLKFHVVHCPRSHRYFGHSPFPFQRLRSLDFNVCLGTDSLASNEDLSLFSEMRQFQRDHPNVSCREILELVTINPARALRYEKLLGKISPGYCADLLAIPHQSGRDIFEEVIGFDRPVPWSMMAGIASDD